MGNVSEFLDRAGLLIWPWLFVFGACTGSFLNVVVYRLPRGQSLSHPGSRCPACGHPIRWYHNLPIVSWFWLRGKCYDCSAPFSFRYPLVELANGLLFVGIAVLELRPQIANPLHAEFVLTGGESAFRYVYHLWLLDTLLCAALIARDGQRAPQRMLLLALIVGLIGALACPAVQPRFAQIVPTAWALDSRLAAFVEAVAGALVGLLAGWVFALAGRSQNRSEPARSPQHGGNATTGGPMPLTAGCVGAFLGWQAPVLAGLLTTVAWLAASQFSPGPERGATENLAGPSVPTRRNWNALLLLAAILWLVVSRKWLDHLPVWLP
jgi:prepilin signal peptidase PulO-like enzyme (type II secretory pathway)